MFSIAGSWELEGKDSWKLGFHPRILPGVSEKQSVGHTESHNWKTGSDDYGAGIPERPTTDSYNVKTLG